MAADLEVGDNAEEKFALREVGAALWELTGDVGGWRAGDISLGLYYLKRDKDRKRKEAAPEPHPEPITDLEFVAEIRYWLEIIEGTYKKSDDTLCATTVILKKNLLASEWVSKPGKPAWYVCTLPRREMVVLAIRGTANISDALTDVSGAQDEFMGGRTHRGMMTSARWFIKNVKPIIDQALVDNPGYGVKVVGHSLGGATAALVTLLLNTHPDAPIPATGFVIAPATCLSLELARDCGRMVTTLVLGHDCVPRFSMAALEELREEIEEFPWQTQVMDEAMQYRMVQLCSSGGSALAGAAGAVSSTAKTVANLMYLKRWQTKTLSDDEDEGEGEEGGADSAEWEHVEFTDADKAACAPAAYSAPDYGSATAGEAPKRRTGAVMSAATKGKPAQPAVQATYGKPTDKKILVEHPEFEVPPEPTPEPTPKPEQPAVPVVKSRKPLNEVVKLYPPGNCYHIIKEDKWVLTKCDNSEFGVIELSDYMLHNHKSSNYIRAMLDIEKNLLDEE